VATPSHVVATSRRGDGVLVLDVETDHAPRSPVVEQEVRRRTLRVAAVTHAVPSVMNDSV
jgi:hypothetical protein